MKWLSLKRKIKRDYNKWSVKKRKKIFFTILDNVNIDNDLDITNL